jgi:GAF domain-containing protein
MIRRLFSPPRFSNDEDAFRARFIHGFSWIVIAVLLIFLVLNFFAPTALKGVGYTTYVFIGLIAVLLTALYILRRGYVYSSGLIVIILGWLGLGFQAFTADGVRDAIIIAYIAIGLLASIILSWRAGGIVILSSIVAIWVLALLEASKVYIPRVQDPLGYARDLTLIFISIASLIYFSTNSLRDAIARATKSEQGLLASNTSLQELNQTLEERVSNRTMELEIASKTNERRARQFRAVAQVANVISNISDQETLLPRIAQVISDQFGHYHTGIFLLDNAREYAVLRTANSIGGKKMLAREHKLLVGQTGIVGYVTATGRPRIALDVGADAVFFDNPELPNTRSEIALPLRVAGQIIGALDVQSEEENAFKEDDIAALSTMADQVSIAIQNTNILEEAQKSLVEAQSAYSESVLESWKVMRTQSLGTDIQLIDLALKPLEKPFNEEHIQKAVEAGKTTISSDKKSGFSLAIPIRMRGQVIGVMCLKNKKDSDWTEDDIDIAEAVAERLSLAMETASLLSTAQHRANIERITTDISTKIGASSRFDTILQTAAQELSKALGGSDVLVQIESVALELGMAE